jgi:hypothetical protein
LKLLPGHVGGLGFKLAKVGRRLRICESRVSPDYSSEPATATQKSRGGAGAWAAVVELAAEAELATEAELVAEAKLAAEVELKWAWRCPGGFGGEKGGAPGEYRPEFRGGHGRGFGCGGGGSFGGGAPGAITK